MDHKDKRSFIHGRETDPIPIYFRPRPARKVICQSDSEEELVSNIETGTSQSSIKSSASIVSGAVGAETANVFLRIRPVDLDAVMWKFRIETSDTFVAANIENVQTKNKNTVEQHYKFNHVFDHFTTQLDIYNKCVRPLICLDDSITILVYGTSGSGKTYTLLGDSCNPGLVPRTLSQLFIEYGNNINTHPICKLQNGTPIVISDGQIYQEQRIKYQLLNSLTDSQSFNQMLDKLKIENNFETKFVENCQLFIWISFVEIYNEKVYDLLADPLTDSSNSNTSTERKNLKVISNNGHPFVQDAAQIFVRTFDETIKILHYGMNHVSTGSTIINERSSRSHCIFFVNVIKTNLSTISVTSYKLCDLAGSERLKKTGNIGRRLNEAKNINKSLMTLGRCLAVANERQKNKSISMPYRDSKLTTLLQNALLGHEKISLIVNLNPKIDYIEENLNVLSFSSIAKKIITKSSERINRKTKRITRYSIFLSTIASPSLASQRQSMVSVIDFTEQIDNLLDINKDLENRIALLHQEKIEHEIAMRTSIVASLEDDYNRMVEQNERQIVTIKKNYSAQIDHFRNSVKYKTKCLEKKNKLIAKLRDRIKQLRNLNDVYVCTESDETETDESD